VLQSLCKEKAPIFGNGEPIEDIFLKIVTTDNIVYCVIMTDERMQLVKAGSRYEAQLELLTKGDDPCLSGRELNLDAKKRTVELIFGNLKLDSKDLFQVIPFAVMTENYIYVIHSFLGLDQFQVITKPRLGRPEHKINLSICPSAKNGSIGSELRISAAGLELYDGEKIILSTKKREDKKT
jgi:hypothetical protein